MNLSDLGLSFGQALSVNLLSNKHLGIMIEIDFAGDEVAEVETVVYTDSVVSFLTCSLL